MLNPFFSVIIPTFNREKIILETIKSVLNQTFKDFELILVDDGSTDNTKNIILDIRDSRIKYIYQENAERSVARNNGIKRAKGKWVCFLDSDDLYKKNHLETIYNEIQKNKKEINFYFTGQEDKFFPENIKRKHNTKFTQNNAPLFFAKESIVPGRVCILKEILLKFKFDEKILIVEDTDLWFRISCYNKVRFINSPTFIYCIHEENSINVSNNAYQIRLNGLKRTFSKPEKKFLDNKQIKKILSDCYFGIFKHYLFHNKLAVARLTIMKSIILYPSFRLKEKIYLLVFTNKKKP